jgi:hypothetical protein
MQGGNPPRAILGGVAATAAMTAAAYYFPVGYFAPGIGLRRLDFAGIMDFLAIGEVAPPWSATWAFGLLLQFIFGVVVFAPVYAFLFYPLLPGRPWVKGLTWGFILWILSEIFTMPMLRLGLFSRNAPHQALALIGALAANCVYGVVLGAVAGPQVTQFEDEIEEPGPELEPWQAEVISIS